MTITEKRSALANFHTDRLIRIGRTVNEVADYMEWMNGLTPRRINKMYYEQFEEVSNVDPGC